MADTPSKEQQILDAHCGLIHRVVIASQNPGMVPDMEQILEQAEQNGWTSLVMTIRNILSGSREPGMLRMLDEEDAVIVNSILLGIQNPATLPPLDKAIDGNAAAPGLAMLIHATRSGNMEALDTIATMATQMSQAGGDMARIAAIMRPLSLGERDADKLCEGLDGETEKLVLNILAELAKLEAN